MIITKSKVTSDFFAQASLDACGLKIIMCGTKTTKISRIIKLMKGVVQIIHNAQLYKYEICYGFDSHQVIPGNGCPEGGGYSVQKILW